MPLDIIADFFNLINIQLFDSVSALLVISFIVWEIPRSIKIISEEYTRGVYPENGRVADFFLFIVGIGCILYFLVGAQAEQVIAFLKTPGVTAFYLILMVTVPLIIALSFFKRFFGRIDKNESVTIFLVHGFLDLMHTIFFITLAVMAIPIVGFLIGLK